MNLITNGTFDIPNISAASGFSHFTISQVPNFGWAIAWTSGTSGNPTAEVQKSPADGQYAELASTAPYQISQIVNPLPGQDYVFSFRAKARPGYVSSFVARLKKSNDVTVEYRIDPGSDWKTYTFCQCPGNQEVVVSFTGTGTTAGGAFIDDVRYIN